MVRIAPVQFKKVSAVAAVLLSALFCSELLLTAAGADDLTVHNAGQGSGTISGTVGCSVAAESDCIIAVTNGTPLTLSAAPRWHSIFSGWGAPCSGTGSCSFTFSSATTLPATFTPNLQAVVLGGGLTEYATLADAYSNVVVSGSTVAAHVYTFHEDLLLNQPITVILDGGKGEMYLPKVGYTTILGSLAIQDGCAVIDAFIIQ